MSRSMSMSMLLLASALAARQPWLPEAVQYVSRRSSPTPNPWRSKLHNRHITVAAMKRHARKSRNIRARSSKRRA